MPFLVIIVVLVIRGRGLPLRGSITDRLPRVGTGRIRPALVVVVVRPRRCSGSAWAPRATGTPRRSISATFAIVGLSVVVLTGYTGQLSLAQFALAGIGAFAAAKLVAAHGWRFEPALLVGVLVAMAIGFLFGLPALRTRGVNLAVVTFGLGFAVHQLVFSNSAYTENARVQPTDLSLFGVPIDPIGHARNYAVRLRRLPDPGRARGRQPAPRPDRPPAARRTHQRARGRGDRRQRLRGQALRLHALGRHRRARRRAVRLRLRRDPVQHAIFQPGASISVLVLTVIGSAGYLAGPMLGSLLASSGADHADRRRAARRTPRVEDTSTWQQYLPLVTGVLLLVVLILNQNGVAERFDALTRRFRDRGSPGCGPARPSRSRPRSGRRSPARTLVVSGLTQRFGGFTALEDVSLQRRARRGGRAARPERRRQDHAHRLRGRQQPADRRLDHLGRRRTSPAGRRTAAPGPGSRARSSRSSSSTTSPCARTCSPPPTRATGSPTSPTWSCPGHPPLPAPVVAAVEELSLAPLLDRRAEDLSYGQRRLVAIARAVASSPSVLLLDEPAAGLDETESAELGRLVRRLADEWGMGVLLIEHDVALVLANADRVVVLDFGHKIAEGTPAEIRNDPAVRKAYLGEEAEATRPNARLSAPSRLASTALVAACCAAGTTPGPGRAPRAPPRP